MEQDSSDPKTKNTSSLSRKANPSSSLIQHTGIAKSLQALTSTNPLSLSPNQRTQKQFILSETEDIWWKNKVGVKFTMERKVDGLPSIFLNNIQHSGTHFFNSRLHGLSYAKINISSYPYLIPAKFTDFHEGGYFAQDHLQFNNYNAIRLLELLETGKVVLHFRDPRSVILSMAHLMCRKNNPEQVHIESTRWGSEIIPLDFCIWETSDKLEFLIKHYYKIFCSDFVNNWLTFAKSLDDRKRKNLLITEFKELKDSPQNLFAKILNFLNVSENVKKIPNSKELPKGFWDKTKQNNHFRRGLLDEWKEACNPRQIKFMSELISDDCYKYFNWEK